MVFATSIKPMDIVANTCYKIYAQYFSFYIVRGLIEVRMMLVSRLTEY